jgi:uncharacterized protein (TIGR02145 family)
MMKNLILVVFISIVFISCTKENPDGPVVTSSSVTIGSQVWTNKNLDVDRYRNGDPIPQVTDPNQWANLTTGAWCYYNNNPSKGAVYGKLYNWYAVNDPRGLAPQGWHIPNDSEWKIMTKFMDPTVDTTCQCLSGTTIGNSLKSTSGWLDPFSTSGDGNGNNNSGFTGLPGGSNNFTLGSANMDTVYGRWWSSSTSNVSDAWYYSLSGRWDSIYRNTYSKSSGFSVRLVKD